MQLPSKEDRQKAAQQRANPWARPDEPLNTTPRPKLGDLFAATREAEQAKQAEAEATRLANMTQFDIWYSTLPRPQQKQIDLWEQTHPGLAYPMPNGQPAALKNGVHRTIPSSLGLNLQPKPNE